MIHPTGRRESEEEGVRERGRYRIKGPTALPDAVCVEHMEDAAEDSRVCNEKAWHSAWWRAGGNFRGHSTAMSRSTLDFPPKEEK